MKINAVITGSSGMIGQGVLMECLENENVEKILLLNRSKSGLSHPKVTEIILPDVSDPSEHLDLIKEYNAIYYCLGTSAVGKSDAEYERITYTMTLAFAQKVHAVNPDAVFIYISADGADSTEKSSMFWAKTKGRIENAIRSMGFRKFYSFRPGFIRPLRGIRSRTPAYNLVYIVLAPLLPLIERLFKNGVTNTEKIGKAMISVTQNGYTPDILFNKDINKAAAGIS